MSVAKELVCVVDDDQSVRRGLRRLFKSAGYAAETFASAEDYLAREIFEGPICLVLDVRMPGLKGPALQEALEPRGACEQIIFITGHGDVPTATRAMMFVSAVVGRSGMPGNSAVTGDRNRRSWLMPLRPTATNEAAGCCWEKRSVARMRFTFIGPTSPRSVVTRTIPT